MSLRHPLLPQYKHTVGLVIPETHELDIETYVEQKEQRKRDIKFNTQSSRTFVNKRNTGPYEILLNRHLLTLIERFCFHMKKR